MMLAQWSKDRWLNISELDINATLPVYATINDPLSIPPVYNEALVHNLACRLCVLVGEEPPAFLLGLAKDSLAVIRRNNQLTPLHGGVPSTVVQLLFLALREAGRITDEHGVTDGSADVDAAFSQLVMMMAQWSKKRWLVFDDIDVSTVSAAVGEYTIGPGGLFNCARPDRIESAFVRMGSTYSGTNSPIDYPLEVLDSREDYYTITAKSLGGVPQAVWLDSKLSSRIRLHLAAAGGWAVGNPSFGQGDAAGLYRSD